MFDDCCLREYYLGFSTILCLNTESSKIKPLTFRTMKCSNNNSKIIDNVKIYFLFPYFYSGSILKLEIGALKTLIEHLFLKFFNYHSNRNNFLLVQVWYKYVRLQMDESFKRAVILEWFQIKLCHKSYAYTIQRHYF